jgi:CO/xanthine dehydrogenase FAD-binding subunit
MEQFIFEIPKNVKELVECLRNADSRTFILNGGTELVVRFRNFSTYSGRLIDISGIKELNYIKIQDDQIKIGANVTFAEIGDSEIIKKYAPCIGQLARQVGSKQIRNAARMAGNIANSSPGGDSIPALLAVGAKVKIINGKGEITYKTIDELVVGINKNTLQKDEAIIEISIPQMGEGYRSVFLKYGMGSSRTTVVIANISVTAVVKYDNELNIIESASVVLGSAAPVAYHATKAEELLKHKVPESRLGEAFSDALADHVVESIKGVKIFLSKIDSVKGLGLSAFEELFAGMVNGGVR